MCLTKWTFLLTFAAHNRRITTLYETTLNYHNKLTFATPSLLRQGTRFVFPPLYQQTGIVAQHGLLRPTG